MRAVVIGGAGFIGRRLVALARGAEGSRPAGWPHFEEVHVLDTMDIAPSAEGARITSARGDVRSRADLREAMAGADVVFHLASVVDVGMRKSRTIHAVNVEGTRNVVEVARELGVPNLIYTSSEDVVLGKTPVAGGDERTPYADPVIHDYVGTKIEAEKIVRAAHDARLATVSLRPVHVYGPDDPHAIVTSLRAFKNGTVPFLLGDGKARFDVVYVDNVAHAHLLAAGKLLTSRGRREVGGQAYFVGEDNALNYFDFLRPFAAAKGIRMPKRFLGRRRTALVAQVMELAHHLTGAEVPFHSFHRYVIAEDFFFDGGRARRELGYAPIVSKEEGLRRTLSWLERVAID